MRFWPPCLCALSCFRGDNSPYFDEGEPVKFPNRKPYVLLCMDPGTARRGPDQCPIECWYSVKPIPEQTAAMIQKRSMIFVSDQAIISK